MTRKEDARQRISELVRRFNEQATYYKSPAYSEAQARVDFITPLFAALGWDIGNVRALPPDQREVVQEPLLADEAAERSTRPDYAFRRGRDKVFYVEAKKPSVDIAESRAAAFQARNYGASGGTAISVLTNFHQIAIYRSELRPSPDDHPATERLPLIEWENFDDDFETVYSALAKESVDDGTFAQFFDRNPLDYRAPFDSEFLEQLRSWRILIAEDMAARHRLSNAELTSRVQRFINRIVFLRIAEDRQLESTESLKRVASEENYENWQRFLDAADARYNSCIFHGASDIEQSGEVSAGVLRTVVDELYLPHSPYTFAVVQPEVLGAIYEQFLGEEITQQPDGGVRVEEKAEVLAGGGVAVTPRYIADAIVERTLGPLVLGKEPRDILRIRVADIACGSGTFLLSAYEYLLNAVLRYYIEHGVDRYEGSTIFRRSENDWRLLLSEKRNILLNCIFGIDIDIQAVEVTRFGLLLKLIEDESAESVAHFRRNGDAALPSLAENIKWGNSLVDTHRLNAALGDLDGAELERINPMSVEDEFRTVFAEGGFSSIIGNPPYVRIQRMRRYASVEVDYYRAAESQYSSATTGSFDKYSIFFVRAVQLLRPRGRLGYITPHKFFKARGTAGLRGLLTQSAAIESIVDFGLCQVFADRTTYTSILVAVKR